MVILVFTEQRESKIKKSSFEAVSAAHKLAGELGGTSVALVVGSGVDGIAGDLGAYGASRVIVVDSPRLEKYSNAAYAKVIAEVAKKEQAAIVVLPASQMGKDLAPRVAVKLNAGLASRDFSEEEQL